MFTILMLVYCLSVLNPRNFKIKLKLSKASIKKKNLYLVLIRLLRCQKAG